MMHYENRKSAKKWCQGNAGRNADLVGGYLPEVLDENAFENRQIETIPSSTVPTKHSKSIRPAFYPKIIER